MKKVVWGLLCLALCCLFVCAGSLFAQQATVNHGVSLRRDPSTNNPPIEHSNKNATVTLLAKRPRVGFYHVQTADGTKGWVGVKYLTVEEPSTGTPPSPPSAPTTTVAGSTGCDDNLWNYVYNPQRLIVKDKCVTVTGTIVDATNGRKRDGVRHEAGGDTGVSMRKESLEEVVFIDKQTYTLGAHHRRS